MKSALFVLAAATSLNVTALKGCGGKSRAPVEHQVQSYGAREPGSVGTPTNETSLMWMSRDGPRRFLEIEWVITEAGNQCANVTRAIFKGGVGGIDEWRVSCSDSGEWVIWLRPDKTEISQCTPSTCASNSSPLGTQDAD